MQAKFVFDRKKSAGLTPLVRLTNITSNVAVLRTDFAIAKSGFNLKNKKVTIVGAARSGIAAAEVVLRLGGIAKISEHKPLSAFSAQIQEFLDPARLVIEDGGHTQAFIEDSDYLVLSPGVRWDALPVLWARARGIEVMGEVEFGFRLCPCPIVAITGSNGKTTTATVIAAILQKAGRGVCLCGNIGSPLSRHVLDLKASDTVVLEVSSFQLESTIDFKPHVAVWTNFSQNHLDRHRDLDEYFEAKCRIFANQDKRDVAVLNGADAQHQGLSPQIKSRVVFFNDPQVQDPVDNPNYAAAVCVARVLGIEDAVSFEVFKSFRGVEHRLEFVRVVDGVDFINDSKSTTPQAGCWALERAQKPVVMICGGLDKHLDYVPVKSLVAQKVKHIIAIGQARAIMKATFEDIVPVDMFTALEDAVHAARHKALPGMSVLFSPMCASFDMFKDYEHRGACFKEIVNGLK